MRVFLCGATGFIGSHLLESLLDRGHHVTCLVRPWTSDAAAGGSRKIDRLRQLPSVRVVEGQWTQPESWLSYLCGHDAVVNAVGVLRESRGSSFEMVHTVAPVALFEEAARTGIRKVVQISALGADEHAISRFHLSKREADRALAQLPVPYLVLRPSFVYGRGSHSMALFARLASLPVVPVPGDGHILVQPMHIRDLARAVVLAAEQDELRNKLVDVGGGRVLSFVELLELLAARNGRNSLPARIYIPWSFMGLAATVTDLIGGLGPITRDELIMLRRGSCTSNEEFVRLFGFTPVPFDDEPNSGARGGAGL